MQATNKVADNLSTNNLMIVLLLLTLIIIGASGLVAKTLITGLIRDTKVLSAENKANKALDENLEAAPQLISSYQSLGPTSRVLADALPNDSNFPGLIVALENIAADASVTLKSVAPAQVLAVDAPADASSSSAIEPPKPMVYAYTVTFDGSYTSLQRFLGNLEIYGRPMRVRTIKLSGSGSSLSGSMDIETYYQAKATLPIAKETIE